MSVSTRVLPDDNVVGPDGMARIEGFVMRASRAAPLGFAALWAFVLGVFLSIVALPGMSPDTHRALDRIGYGVQGTAVALATAAIATHRRHRTPLLIELRAEASGPMTEDTVRSLRAAAGDTAAWVVSERRPTAGTLAAARVVGVRWFAAHHTAFRELEAAATSTGDVITDARPS